MALIKAITLDSFGETMEFPDALHWIDSITENGSMVYAIVSVFKAERDEGGGLTVERKMQLKQFEVGFAPDWNGPNYRKQAYDYLKTLPDYAGAADA
jgi:hypothetical protein